jgi:hypothetical protein
MDPSAPMTQMAGPDSFNVMAALSDAVTKSVLHLLANQGRSDATDTIRTALKDCQLAIRVTRAIVSSEQFKAGSPEPFAELLLEPIDQRVVDGLVATPYAPNDTDSAAAMASLLCSVTQDNRTDAPISFTPPFTPLFPVTVHGFSFYSDFAFLFFSPGLLIAKAACSTGLVAARILQTIDLSPEQIRALVPFAISVGLDGLTGLILVPSVGPTLGPSVGPIDQEAAEAWVPALTTLIARYPHVLSAPDLTGLVLDALSSHLFPADVPQTIARSAALLITDRIRTDDDSAAAHAVALVASKVGSSHAALAVLTAVVSIDPASVELAMAASQLFDEADGATFATLARCLFDPSSGTFARTSAMAACISAALDNCSDSSLLVLTILAETNRSLFCRCIADEPLRDLITCGADPAVLFDAIRAIDPSLLPDVLAAITRPATAIEAIREGNTTALLSLLRCECVLPGGTLAPAPKARVFAALKNKSPFKTSEAAQPEVFASLLALVAQVRPESWSHAELVDRLGLMHPLIHSAAIGAVDGADDGASDGAAMVGWVAQSLGCTVLATIKSGTVVAAARDAGNHALIATILRLVADQKDMVAAVTHNELFAELISPGIPTWLLELVYSLSTQEAQARTAAAATSCTYIQLSMDNWLSMFEAETPAFGATERAELEFARLVDGLDTLWTRLVRLFAASISPALPADERGVRIATLERLLRLGDDARLTVERVYADPHDHSFLYTAFSLPWITQLIVESNAHQRLELLRSWASLVRSSRPAAATGATMQLGNSLHIFRSDLESKERAVAAVRRVTRVVSSNGGYSSLGPESFRGVISVSLTEGRAELIVRDSATGSGAHRDVAQFLVRLCLATGVLFSGHPAGPVPIPDADPETLRLLGFAIGTAIVEGLTLGRECLAPCVLAYITGTPISLARSLFLACFPPHIEFPPCPVDTALSFFGPLTDHFTTEDEAALTPTSGLVCSDTLPAFLDSVEARILTRTNALDALAAGLTEAIGTPHMHSLRLILTDAQPMMMSVHPAGPVGPGNPAGPMEPTGQTGRPAVQTTRLIESLVVGNTPIDPAGLQANTLYEETFNETSPIVIWFWRIVHAMDQATLRTLLRFWTSGSPPPDGVHPSKYIILPKDQPNLPSASTCIYTLYLYDSYTSLEALQRHITIALENTDSGMEG